jgi:hypothetical protein
MLRKTIVALFAIASIGLLVPDAASARGGFGGGRGGGFHGGGFRAGGIGMGGAGFRAAAVGPGFRSAGPVGFRGGTLAANSFRGGFFRPGFRHRGFPFAAAAVVGAGLAYGAGYPYGYYDDSYYYGGDPYYANYPYDDEGNYAYGVGYGDGGCYVVRQRIPTPYGWVLRPVQVCN